jgi:hypothetical protein
MLSVSRAAYLASAVSPVSVIAVLVDFGCSKDTVAQPARSAAKTKSADILRKLKSVISRSPTTVEPSQLAMQSIWSSVIIFTAGRQRQTQNHR